MTLKRKQVADKLKLSSPNKLDKYEAAVQELNEAKTAEEESRDLLKKISDAIRDQEWPLLHENSQKETKNALTQFARVLLSLEKRKLQDIEQASRDVLTTKSGAL